jgi:hypothetical protein
MKVYDYQWAETFGMTPAMAAEALCDDGITTVLMRNGIDPLPDSGVDQSGYGPQRDLRALDLALAAALREAGMTVYQTTALFFDPTLVQRFPDARPIDAKGAPTTGFDWYLGACPTHEGYLAEKVERMVAVVRELRPDGYFLSFTRYPGFWENWVPSYRFSDADRFCFCDRCRLLFARDLDLALPEGNARTQAAFILDRHGAAWTRWRCGRILAAVQRIALALRAEIPGLPLMLNTLPFPASDFEGLNPRREIVAQDLSLLSSVFDRFELMTYLQILDRPDAWLGEVLHGARQEAPNSGLLCTLQVAPLYTEGVHAGRGRTSDIAADELDATARAALDAGAEGLVFYHWTDFLIDEAEGGRKRQVLRGLTHG